MSIIDVISIAFTIALAACAIAAYLRLKSKVDDGEGFCSINERGAQDGSEDGDVVFEVRE